MKAILEKSRCLVFITIEFIEIVDSFLIATAILIFAVSLHELFIGDINLPGWMLAHNLRNLKAKLSSMVALVMGVKFLQKLVDYKDAWGCPLQRFQRY